MIVAATEQLQHIAFFLKILVLIFRYDFLDCKHAIARPDLL